MYLGRYAINHKGLDRLIQAIKILKNENRIVPKIILAGPDSSNGYKYIIRFIKQHSLERYVDAIGPVHGDAKTALLMRSRLMVHTSRWEGLPLVLLEAIAHGVPCLLTKGTNVSYEWQEAGCALHVDDSPESIANGILKMLDRDVSVDSFNAVTLAKKEYSWESIAKKLVDIYYH